MSFESADAQMKVDDKEMRWSGDSITALKCNIAFNCALVLKTSCKVHTNNDCHKGMALLSTAHNTLAIQTVQEVQFTFRESNRHS